MQLLTEEVFSLATLNTAAGARQISNETITEENSIKVYPTISRGNITISTSKVLGNTKVSLFDLNGRNVYSVMILN